MAFLTINGVTVSVKECSLSWVEVGQRDRSVNGGYLVNRTALKRQWKCTTAPMLYGDAQLLMELLTQGHDVWRFNSSNNPFSTTSADVLSAKGSYVTNTPVYQITSSKSADNKTVQTVSTDATTITDVAKFGTGSLICSVGGLNMVTSNQSTGTSGYATIAGGTRTDASTDAYWQGTASVKLVAASSGDGFESTVTGAPATALHWASVHLYSASNLSVTVSLRDNASTSLGSTTQTIPAGKWLRVGVSGTPGGGATGLKLRVTANAAGTFYADGLQIEQNAVLTYWIEGGATRPALTTPQFASTVVSSLSSFSVALWTRGTNVASTGVFGFRESATINSVKATFNASSKFTVTVLDSLGASSTISEAAAVSTGEWTHYVITYNATSKLLTLYKNGASAGTATLTNDLTLTNVGALNIGEVPGSTSAPSGRHIDDFAIFGYELQSTAVTSIYNSATQLFSPLELICNGDFNGGISTTCIGLVPNSTYKRLFQSSAWKNNLLEVDFMLEEI